MESIKFQAHTGADGVLKLELPTGKPNVDLEVLVVLQPLETSKTAAPPKKRDWPPGFFENVIGSLKDEPVEREPEGDYEVRVVS